MRTVGMVVANELLTMTLKIKREPGLKTFGIYHRNGKLLRGGFTSRADAEETLQEWRENEAEYASEREDVYDNMSAADRALNDRLDYAREVEQAGDPERASEIRFGA